MRYALLQGGRVTDVVESGYQPEGWTAIPENVGPGFVQTGDGWSAPQAVSTVPAAVSMRQARLALEAIDKLDTVNAMIAGMPGKAGKAARIEWEFSNEVRRTQPLVLQMGAALGMTAAEMDQLFITAEAL